MHVLSTPPAFVLSQDQTLRTKTKTLKPRKTNQTKRSVSNPNQKHSKTKNRHKTKTNKHTIEFTNNTHTIKHTQMLCMFSKGVSRHVSAISALRFVRCRSAQQEELYALARRSSNRGFVPPSTRTSAGFRGFRQDSAPYQAIFPRFSCARTQNVTQSVCHDALQTARRTPLTWRYSRTITFFAQNFTAR